VNDVFGTKAFLRHGPVLLVVSLRTKILGQKSQVSSGTFTSPPQLALLRRDQARIERRKIIATRRIEARRMAEVAAALARGEYPGHG
jgi:hypothetical protein